MRKIEIKTIDKHGMLTIIREIEPHVQPSGQTKRKVLCECDCGNKKEVQLHNLRSGHTTSCGCHQKEKTAEVNITHGMYNHHLYMVWNSMKDRCNNSNHKQYSDYGGRGITVCPEWNSSDATAFLEWALASGYKKGLQIDRIDNNKGYNPSNCRFVTRSTNQMNKRKYKNCSSNYRGVSFKKDRNKYEAHIAISDGKIKYLGSFETELEAAKAYDSYIIENNLPNKLNFNDDIPF